jgi:hypothetical protein
MVKGHNMSDIQTAWDVKNWINTEAVSHVFEAVQYMKTPITTDMSEDDIQQAIREGCESYEFSGINTQWEAFLVVTGSEFPNAEDLDFTGMDSSMDCMNQEANQAANELYRSELNDEICEAAARIFAIVEKAQELGFDGQFQVSGSSLYGWEAHNYETDCGICIWSDEKVHYAYNPSLLEGELWAIEGTWNGLTIGACWTPAND